MESTGSRIGDGISNLPEECISHVIGRTSPRDACVSSAVSASFRSAADSDATWQRFLPSDYPLILSRAVDPVEYGSKKELFFRLCDHPILIDDGKMSFGLERWSGAKCFTLSARALEIVWAADTRYWNWVPLSASRFSEAVELKEVCWLEIRGKIGSNLLSPNTKYTAHLLFKLTENAYGLGRLAQEAFISVAGETVCKHSVRLQQEEDTWRRRRGWLGPIRIPQYRPGVERREEQSDVRLAQGRNDGWMEMEMGEFYTNNNNNEGVEEVEMSLMEIHGGFWKRGLVVLGIEIRPKL